MRAVGCHPHLPHRLPRRGRRARGRARHAHDAQLQRGLHPWHRRGGACRQGPLRARPPGAAGAHGGHHALRPAADAWAALPARMRLGQRLDVPSAGLHRRQLGDHHRRQREGDPAEHFRGQRPRSRLRDTEHHGRPGEGPRPSRHLAPRGASRPEGCVHGGRLVLCPLRGLLRPHELDHRCGRDHAQSFGQRQVESGEERRHRVGGESLQA
mmetsp:Transcript_80439/g.236628  ORF Transcript_80439/g.236628 Transcript_80439/m.236628 type:complete len:211 (+) Transcript_80439:839-1471(+)